MAKRVTMIRRILIGALAVLIGVGLVGWSKRSYKGRLISTWITESHYRSAISETAIQAVHDMGIKCVPVMMEMLQAQDSPFELRVIDWTRKHLNERLWPFTGQDKQRAAIGAIGFLNPEARRMPVPELNRMLNNTNLCNVASGALVSIGAEGIPYLNMGLTNSQEIVRQAILDEMRGHPSLSAQLEIMMPNLCVNASGPNQFSRVQYSAYEMLYRIGKRPDLTVPVLMERWRSFSKYDSSEIKMFSIPEIMRGIDKFGTNARVAIPEFVKALGARTRFGQWKK